MAEPREPGAERQASAVTVYEGDCLEVLRGLPDNSVDAVVTDPPYGLSEAPDTAAVLRAWLAGEEFVHGKPGFMGRTWDSFVPGPAPWREVLRVLKPGGHLLAFFATRTEDMGSLAIRLAGFERRDLLAWLYGSGFAKGLDVSKAIDAHLGAERTEVVGSKLGRPGMAKDGSNQQSRFHAALTGDERGHTLSHEILAAATPQAAAAEGWRTQLKPALEPAVLFRKPLAGTVAETFLEHGTGALNVDACRIGWATDTERAEVNARTAPNSRHEPENSDGSTGWGAGRVHAAADLTHAARRFPSNVTHDGSPEVLDLFPTEAGAFAPVRGTEPSSTTAGILGARNRVAGAFHGDGRASAGRFFYSPKADATDRMGSSHLTVKPVDLIAYFVRLLTPPGGVVLDPFAGSGTTGEAALREGMRAVLIELDPDHVRDIRRRLDVAEGRISAREAKRARVKPAKAGGLDLPLLAPAAAEGPDFV